MQQDLNDIALKTLSLHDFKGEETVLHLGCSNPNLHSNSHEDARSKSTSITTSEWIARNLVPRGRVLAVHSESDSPSNPKESPSTNAILEKLTPLPNLTFESCSATKLAEAVFQEGHTLFDVIFSCYFLQDIRDHESVLDGIGSLLRANSILLMSFPWEISIKINGNSRGSFDDLWRGIAKQPKYASSFENYHLPSYISKEWKQEAKWTSSVESGYSSLLRTQGFLPEIVRLDQHSTPFHTREDFLTFMRKWEPTHMQIDDLSLREEYFLELFSKLEESCLSPSSSSPPSSTATSSQDHPATYVLERSILYIKAKYQSELDETADIISPRKTAEPLPYDAQNLKLKLNA